MKSFKQHLAEANSSDQALQVEVDAQYEAGYKKGKRGGKFENIPRSDRNEQNHIIRQTAWDMGFEDAKNGRPNRPPELKEVKKEAKKRN